MERRSAVRALLVDQDSKDLLLIRCVVPDTGVTIWITPGGAIDEGEDDQHALKREVFEETGLQLDTCPKQHIWERTATFTFNGETCTQDEKYFLVPVEHFEPINDNFADEMERQALKEFRWWSVSEILASDETFVPERLGDLFNQLIETGEPAAPIDTGV